MRIYLIGFMATGKSTLGQQVAEKLNVPFLDTDRMIESQTGMSVAGIFANDGEKVFRELEAEIIRQTTISEKALIATGGGLPCHHDNMEWMNEHGITMHLSWPDEILKAHIISLSYSRPVLADLTPEKMDEKITLLLAERKPYYEMAAMTIEMEGNIEKDVLTLEQACRYIW